MHITSYEYDTINYTENSIVEDDKDCTLNLSVQGIRSQLTKQGYDVKNKWYLDSFILEFWNATGTRTDNIGIIDRGYILPDTLVGCATKQ